MSALLFVYGTLLPHQPQWPLLSRYVTDEGWVDAVPGLLYDSGFGYPVADLTRPDQHPDQHDGHVYGRCLQLLEASQRIALEALDRYEEVHLGLYQRIEVATTKGHTAWSYSLGPSASRHFPRLEPIPSGDWAMHLSTDPDRQPPEKI